MHYLVKRDGLRVHASDDGKRPMCGGGCGGRAGTWQMDIGPENCRACKTIITPPAT